MQHAQAIGQGAGLVEVVGDQHDGDIEAFAQLHQLTLKPPARHLVHRREGFVEQQHLWLPGQRPGQGHPLTLAAGQLSRQAPLQPFEVDSLEPVRGSQATFTPRQVAQGGGDIVGGVEMRKQRIVLKHQPHPAPLRRPHHPLFGVKPPLAATAHRPRGRSIEPRDGAQQGRLAAARRTDQRQQLPGTAGEPCLERNRPGLGQVDVESRMDILVMVHAQRPRQRRRAASP